MPESRDDVMIRGRPKHTNVRYLSVVAVLLALMAGCNPSPRPEATPTATPRPREHLTADVPWLYSSPSRLFVFVAVIHNPTPRTLDKIAMTWTAYEASGNSVTSFQGDLGPPIGPNETRYVVAGSGISLTRRVERVTTSATAYEIDADPAPAIQQAEIVHLSEVPPPQGRHGRSYRVMATFTAPETGLKWPRLRTHVLLRDASGAIVGADWERRDSFQTGMPSVLAPGMTIRFEDRDIPATAEAARAEVVGYPGR